MIIQPPCIKFNSNYKDNRLYGKAKSLYIANIQYMQMSGLSSRYLTITLLGSRLDISGYRSDIGGFYYGYITISSALSIDEDTNKKLYLETGIMDIYPFGGVINNKDIPHLRLIGNSGINGYANYSKGVLEQLPEPLYDNQETLTYSCEPVCTNLIQKKGDRNSIQPALFPGKLQLFVQSLYGSKRTDYSANNINGYSFNKALRLGNFLLDPEYTSNNWILYTYLDHIKEIVTYFLVQVMHYSFQYIPLELSSTGTIWASELYKYYSSKSPETIRVEAYILSTATLKKTKAGSIDKKIIGTSSKILGEAIHYGWQSNWEGNFVSIVLHSYTNMAGSDEAPVDQIGTEWAYKPRTYTYQLSGSTIDEEIVLDFLLEEATSPPWQVKNGASLIWYPDYVQGGHSVFSYAGTFSTRYVGTFEDSEIICWYNRDDQLEVVTFTDKREARLAGSYLQEHTILEERQLVDGGAEVSHIETSWLDGTAGDVIVKVGSVQYDHIGEEQEGDYTFYRKWWTESLADNSLPTTAASIDTTSNDEYRSDFYKIGRVTTATDWCLSFPQWFHPNAFGGATGNFVEPGNYIDTFGIRTQLGWYESTGKTVGNLIRVGYFFLQVPDDSCTSYIVGDRYDETYGGISEKVPPPNSNCINYWEIFNGKTGDTLNTSGPVAYIWTGDDSTGDRFAPETPLAGYAGAPIVEEATMVNGSETLYEAEGAFGYPSAWYYVSWLLGPFNLGGGGTIKTNLNSSYNIDYKADINFNNDFPGEYPVGYL